MNLNSSNNKFWEDNNQFIPGGSGSAGGVTSVNGMTGVVIISEATTSTAGLMSATDKSNLDSVYADYSSAITALEG